MMVSDRPLSDTTLALIQDVIQELTWLMEHQGEATLEQLVVSRFAHYRMLGLRLRQEDLDSFPMNLAYHAGFHDPQVLSFLTLTGGFFMAMGMVITWTKVAEEVASHAARPDPDSYS